VGYNLRDGAWVWHADTGVERVQQRGIGLNLIDVSDDGKTAVGFTREGAHGGQERALLWREGRGAILLTKYLADTGAIVPEGWRPSVADVISADGRTIYGWGLNPNNLVEMFKVEIN
jgi:hypothetical protein